MVSVRVKNCNGLSKMRLLGRQERRGESSRARVSRAGPPIARAGLGKRSPWCVSRITTGPMNG